ncbi:hypothetical protein CAEBREN_07448 [Caenorhabditis brenneri]|uniref:DUF7809 domain-containing protein n=1 Tax=Caenorhabditis brenneri TaxID=135651 RepID=G0NHU7_CAEBE|nr:hypothetical protein CAEBREN_07448 [Caenorhabditis brenneri]
MPIPTFFHASASIHAAFRHMLPVEHWELISLVETGVNIDASKTSICMYGSQEELAEDVMQFRKFPGSHQFFQGGQAEPYTIAPLMFESLKRKTYLYKHDIYPCLFHSIFGKNFHQDVMPIIAFYLRTIENRMDGVFELIEYPEEELKKFKKFIRAELRNFEKEEKPFAIQLKKGTMKEVFDKIAALLPKNNHDPDYSSVAVEIKEFIKIQQCKKHSKFYETMLNKAALIIQHTSKFFEEHSYFYTPRARYEVPDHEGPAAVRLFKDGEHRFVLAREVLMELQRIQVNVGSLERKIMDLPKLATIQFADLFKMLGANMQKIEFVVYPIKRNMHKTSYIPFSDGEYFIPSADVIIEILHDVIGVKKLFQDISDDRAMLLITLIYEQVHFIEDKLSNCRLVNLETAEKMKSNFNKKLREKIPEVLDKKKQEVYRVDQNGFTCKDLLSEMNRLGYLKTFPILENSVESVYQSMEMTKTNDVFRTCDMHEALERCLRIVFLVGPTEFVTFFHAHGACNRFSLICPICASEIEKKRKKTAEEEKKEEGGSKEEPKRDDAHAKFLTRKLAELKARYPGDQ